MSSTQIIFLAVLAPPAAAGLYAWGMTIRRSLIQDTQPHGWEQRYD